MTYQRTQAAGAFSLPTGSITKLTGMGFSEVVPTGLPTPWDQVNQRAVALSDGWYRITASVQVVESFASPLLLQARVNGSATVNLSNMMNTTSQSGAVLNGSRHVRLFEGDTVDLRARQFSGVARNVTIEEFTVERVGD